MPLLESYLGTVGGVAYSWPNPGWALADGSSLPISQNDALYAVLGTTYGGDGVNVFLLPDLRGRGPSGQGLAAGRTPSIIGTASGREFTTILPNHLPPHEHPVALGGAPGASGTGMAASGSGAVQPMPTSYTGSGEPIGLGPPALVQSFIVCITGLFPPRQDW